MITTLTDVEKLIAHAHKIDDSTLHLAEVTGVGTICVFDTHSIAARLKTQLTKIGMVQVGFSCFRPSGDDVCFHPEVPDRSGLDIDQYFYDRNGSNVDTISFMVEVKGQGLKSPEYAAKITAEQEFRLRLEFPGIGLHPRYLKSGYRLPIKFEEEITTTVMVIDGRPLVFPMMTSGKVTIGMQRLPDNDFIEYVESHIQIESAA